MMWTSLSFLTLLELFSFLSDVHAHARAIRSRDTLPVTSHVFPLMRRSIAQSNKISQLPGIANLSAIIGGVSFSTQVTLGKETFDMVVDTGSSDTWVASKRFKCKAFGREVNQATCQFGPLYDRQTFQKIEGQNFRIEYGDGTNAVGDMGYDSVTLGGINLPKQEIAVVENTFWQGDDHISGLLGLCYPSLTSAYKGTDSTKDVTHQNIDAYDPVFTSMYKQGLIDPVFSLAINRGPENEPAGVLALGGIPPEFQNLKYARTPIIQSNLFDDTSISAEYQFYSIYPSAFFYGPSASSNLTSVTIPQPLTNSTLQNLHIVDSGTTLNLLPKAIADGVAASFIPPAYLHASGLYIVSCNATPPQFGIQIGDQVIYINPKDMMAMKAGTCVSTVLDGGEGEPWILGDPFFKNAVVVFDVGENEIRVAGRENY